MKKQKGGDNQCGLIPEKIQTWGLRKWNFQVARGIEEGVCGSRRQLKKKWNFRGHQEILRWSFQEM